MQSKAFLLTLIFCLLASVTSFSQGTKKRTSSYESHITQAKEYHKVNLLAEALEQSDLAIRKAKNPKEKIIAVTLKGEILRASGDFPMALNCLWSMSKQEIYQVPLELRVKRLGRMAAVHQEYGDMVRKSEADSIIIYIDSALELALSEPEKNQFEIASLYNEIGLYVFRRGDSPKGREYFTNSCKIFKELGEYEQMVTPLSNLLELECLGRDFVVTDSLMEELENLIEGKDWYRVKTIAYNALAIAARIKGDEVAGLRYVIKLYENTLKNREQVNSEKMLVIREVYERDKLQQQVQAQKLKNEKNRAQLEKADRNRRRLLIYLIVALFVTGVIALLMFRERKLKRKNKQINENLREANHRYEMLVIESNHRIKNNLQMIQALLDYTQKGVGDSESRVVRSIAGKINTISALHKYLHSRDHNENISLSLYFNEIERLYANMAPKEFQMSMSVDDVEIGSERIVYFGLILNEMLSNTLEHAPDTINNIQVSVERVDGKWRFCYVDQSKRKNNFKEGMGTQLIRNLIQYLGGDNFEFDPNTGKYQFDFKVDEGS
ncbi:MAG: sensor histidine kinase [bacterium]|nr:sensor histidine kinase [bacterium]